MRLTGPGMSLAASGTMGKTITFSIWKGRAYGRLRVIPKNLRSAGQQLTRGFVGAIAKSAQVVLTAAKDTLPGLGSAFFLATKIHIPSTNSWIAIFQRNQHATVTADAATFAGLGAVKGLYDAEAATMGLTNYVTVGSIPVTYTAGFQLYILAKFAVASLAYVGFAGGIDGATALQLTSFNTYVKTSV